MKFKRKDRLKIRANADLTPMIDVVFQLILFFLLSSTFVVQSSINIQEPIAEGPTELETKEVAITLEYDEANPDGGGNLYFDLDEVSTDGLRERVAELVQMKADDEEPPYVLIRADTRIRTGSLVEVMGILNAAGITKYGVAAQAAEAGGP